MKATTTDTQTRTPRQELRHRASRLGRGTRALRGWSGLLLGLLVALLAVGGPGGARWLGHEAELGQQALTLDTTQAYRTVYVAAAWPADNVVSFADALHRHMTTAGAGPVKKATGPSFPPLLRVSWSTWWRHGVDWRYRRLQAASARAVRRLLPLEAAVVVLLLGLVVGLVLIGRRRHGLEARPSTTFGGARWQTFPELVRRRARPGDLVLGTARQGVRRVVVGVPSTLLVEGVAIIAPSGLGKSNAFYKAHLLEAAPDVDYLVTDPKGETWEQTAGALSRTHDVYRLDMLHPERSVTWNPLALDRTPAQASDWAQALLSNTAGESAPSPAYFELALRTLIAAGIGHVHAAARRAGQPAGTFADLTALLLLPSVEKIAAELKTTLGDVDGGSGPAATFLGLIAEHRDLRTSVPSGLAPRLAALIDPAISAVVGGQGVLDLDRLGRAGRRPLALYIVTPPESATIRPLVAALFTTTFRVLLDRASGLPGGALEREVRLLCDEFGTMGAVPHAPRIFNVCRQARISRVLSLQLRAQLDEDYGERGRAALLESCNALVWLGGTRGDDARWASEVVGKRTALARGEGDSAPRTLFGRRPDRGARSLSETGVPLLYPDDLAASSRRRVIASVREARPMDLRSRPFYTVRRLRWLSRVPAPTAYAAHPEEPRTNAASTAGETALPPPTAGASPPSPSGAVPLSTPAPTPSSARQTPPRKEAPPLMRGEPVQPLLFPPVGTTAPAPLPQGATSRPVRTTGAPVKSGRAHEWRGRS